MTKRSPKAISLFCGAGGCSLGFKRAGYDVIYASDINTKAVDTYRTNFRKTIVEQQDIDQTNFAALLQRLQLRSGELDMLTGGPPCQGFSTAGARFWDDPRNHLLHSYIKGLEIIKPKWFLMENVEGLLTSNRGLYLYEAVKAFIRLGYQIRVEKVYAQEFAIPQRRKRVIIVGNRLGLAFNFPEPLISATGRLFRKSGISITQAIDDLPAPTTQKGLPLCYEAPAHTEIALRLRARATQVFDHEYSAPKGLHKHRIASLGPGQTMKDLPKHLHHQSFKKRANRRVADGTPTEKRGGPPSGLKRLFGSEPSLTITGAAIREFVHPNQDRTLTVRECARLQTFPDTFRFCGSTSDKIRQIGNAIPPDLAYQFALHIATKYGFEGHSPQHGALLGFELTKATAMSPALANTDKRLREMLYNVQSNQLNSFKTLDA